MSSQSSPNPPQRKSFPRKVWEFTTDWNPESSFWRNLVFLLLRWIFGLWILILAITAVALIFVFLLDPAAFNDSPRKKECQIIERGDGTAFDSCDLLVP
jgi:hypothetical protein